MLFFPITIHNQLKPFFMNVTKKCYNWAENKQKMFASDGRFSPN